MFDKKNDAIQSLYKLEQMEMLEKLIVQLNKDLSLSGIETQFNMDWSPKLLIDRLSKIVATLMKNEFHKFMNLLYRIDISEKKIGKIGTSDFDQVVNVITFMILKKEWQKVWFRNRNSQLE
jgi:hypothetical protein